MWPPRLITVITKLWMTVKSLTLTMIVTALRIVLSAPPREETSVDEHGFMAQLSAEREGRAIMFLMDGFLWHPQNKSWLNVRLVNFWSQHRSKRPPEQQTQNWLWISQFDSYWVKLIAPVFLFKTLTVCISCVCMCWRWHSATTAPNLVSISTLVEIWTFCVCFILLVDSGGHFKLGWLQNLISFWSTFNKILIKIHEQTWHGVSDIKNN